MQKEIIERGPLLNKNGNIETPGYAKQLIREYNRHDIKVSKLLIKEWDYYAILNKSFGIALTIADNGYLGFVSITIFDFKSPKELTKVYTIPFPLGKWKMPNTSERGDITYIKKDVSIKFIKKKGYRILTFDIKNFSNKKRLAGSIKLEQPEDMDSLVIATPFNKPRRFYYNQKINCMRASGNYTLGETNYTLDPNVTFGVLDWGRGVWTYNNTWYWSSASGELNGELFGFNLGYGFGDTSNASENMIFYKGIGHKLEEINFQIPKDSYLKQWKITSSDNRINLVFDPIIDRNSDTNILIIQSNQHQVFGYFTGSIVLDNGEVLNLSNFFGFAEKVKNRW